MYILIFEIFFIIKREDWYILFYRLFFIKARSLNFGEKVLYLVKVILENKCII